MHISETIPLQMVFVWALSLLFSVIYYARELLSKRRVVTVTSFVVIMYFIIPVILQYPFVFSVNNIKTIGIIGYEQSTSAVNFAFVIALWGMFWFAVPFAFKVRSFIFINIVDEMYQSVLLLKQSWVLLAFVIVLLIDSVLLYKEVNLPINLLISSGGFRGAMMEHPSLKHLTAIISSLSVFIQAILIFKMMYSRRSRIFWAAAVGIVTSAGLLLGTRSSALYGVVIALVSLYSVKSFNGTISNPLKSFFVLLSIACALVVAAFMLGFLRSDAMPSWAGLYDKIMFSFFYGNNFSDLRDFSWILGGFGGHFLFGKSFFSDMLPGSLLPKYFEAWKWPIITRPFDHIDTVGFPGLRPTLFGEWYLNFGFPGVAVEGFFMGLLVRSIDIYIAKMSNIFNERNSVLAALSGFFIFYISTNFFISTGFFTVYVILSLLICLRMLAASCRVKNSA